MATKPEKSDDTVTDAKAASSKTETRKRGTRVYVGNLDYYVSWQDLKDHMRSAGNVTYANVLQLPDGRSKGCGIVEFETREEANTAIKTLTDSELNGRKIFVREDREDGDGKSSGTRGGRGGARGGGRGRGGSRGGGDAPRGGRGGGAARGRGGFSEPVHKPRSALAQTIRATADAANQVYIGNLPYSVRWQDLKDLCSEYGEIRRADVEELPDGKSKGYGVVVFETAEAAQACIAALNETEYEGRTLVVRLNDAAKSAAARGTRVVIGNLPFATSWQDLKDLCKEFGEVMHSDIRTDRSGRSAGSGVVAFKNSKDAEAAVAALNNTDYEGRTITVALE